jgi:hypothetical protein
MYMSLDAEFLVHGVGRIFAHEGGHALVATLETISCRGIAYDRDDRQICTLTDLPLRAEEYSLKHYFYLAAGVAAERIVCVKEDELEGGESDKRFFENIGAPKFEKTVERVQEILAKRKRTIEYFVSALKNRAKGIECKFDCLPEIVSKGKRYVILLSEQEVKDAVENH